MVLNKGVIKTNSEVLFEANSEVEKVGMNIDKKSMAFIIARLTDLYEEPIVATVREVISNAIDTTMRVNPKHRKPVHVSMPTPLNENFIVEDFGEGMSKETIRTIYSQYGASTKQNDMTQIGAYGLGAKAPLSYCSQFTVESTKDGITTEIIISNEAEGNFTRIVSSKLTGLPNGTTVKIPTKQRDIKSFVDAAETYANFSFNVEIIFHGASYTPLKLEKLNSFVIDKDVNGKDVELTIYKQPNQVIDDPELQKKNEIQGLLNLMFLKSDDAIVKSILSGFVYDDGVRHWGYNRDKIIYVDLVPGVVDFASSRDSITNNERYQNYRSTVLKLIKKFAADEISKEIKEGKFTIQELLELLSYREGQGKRLLDEDKKLIMVNKNTNLLDFTTAAKAEAPIITRITKRETRNYHKSPSFYQYRHENDASRVYKNYSTITKIKETEKEEAFTPIEVAQNQLDVMVVIQAKNYEEEVASLGKLSTYANKNELSNVLFLHTRADRKTTTKAFDKYLKPNTLTYFTYDEWRIAAAPKKSINTKMTTAEEIVVQVNGYIRANDFESYPFYKTKETIKLNELKISGNYSILYLLPVGIKWDRYGIEHDVLSKGLSGLVNVNVMSINKLTKTNVDAVMDAFDEVMLISNPKSKIKYVADVLEKSNLVAKTADELGKTPVVLNLKDEAFADKNLFQIAHVLIRILSSDEGRYLLDKYASKETLEEWSKMTDGYNTNKSIYSNTSLLRHANNYGVTVITDGSIQQEMKKRLIELTLKHYEILCKFKYAKFELNDESISGYFFETLAKAIFEDNNK